MWIREDFFMKQSRYTRKSPKLVQKDTIYIICGGDTEKIYFDLFKKAFQKQIYGRKIKVLKNPRDPISLIQYGIQIRENNKNCLKIWAVFDKDEFNNFDEAIVLAKENNIFCAYSNQAFEVWFINHFQELYTPLHRNKYSDLLEKLLGRKYQKNIKCLNQVIKSLLDIKKIEAAIRNSERCYNKHIREKKFGNYSSYESCTVVYKLVKELLKK